MSFCLWRRTWDSTVRFACRLAYCLLGSPQRLPSNQSLPNDSPNRPPTTLPSRVRVRATFTKNKTTPKRVLFYLWRRTWDSNPRGCYTLLDFQSSSLAARSILQKYLVISDAHLYYHRNKVNASIFCIFFELFGIKRGSRSVMAPASCKFHKFTRLS